MKKFAMLIPDGWVRRAIKDITFAVAMLFGGIAIGVFGNVHYHDYLNEAHDTEHVEHERTRRQPIESFRNLPPDTGFTIHDGEMILIVDGDRVLTLYREDLAGVCADVK